MKMADADNKMIGPESKESVQIKEQKEKLGLIVGEGKQSQKTKEKQPAALPEIKPQISIDEFAKIDLRAGKILEAERVKKSKKLIQMRIDIGSEQRTIVAGIGQHYEPEQLVGKTVVVVVNLQPAKLMGIESQGMVLAGVEEDTLCVTTFDKEAAPGAQVR